MKPLILASASAGRARLLRAAGVDFDVEPATIDEASARAACGGAASAQVALVLAEKKALHVAAKSPGRIVLGADQILDFRGEKIGKCSTLADASSLLGRLRGQIHALVTATVLATDEEILWTYVGTNSLAMRQFSEEFLADYLSRAGEAALGAVGCYEIEGLGAQLFERIEGDLFSIIGLPLVPLLGALRKVGLIDT